MFHTRSSLSNLPSKNIASWESVKLQFQTGIVDFFSVFIETIVKMGQILNMKIVAEGVETQEQVEYLKSISCNLYQGYYFSKPIKAKELEEFYKSL